LSLNTMRAGLTEQMSPSWTNQTILPIFLLPADLDLLGCQAWIAM